MILSNIRKGFYMSYGYMVSDNKHPKVHFEQYLYTLKEPRESFTHDVPAELEAELLESIHSMKRQFRRIARARRSRY